MLARNLLAALLVSLDSAKFVLLALLCLLARFRQVCFACFALLARSIPPSFYLLYGSFKLQKLSDPYPKEEVQTETQKRKPCNAKEQRSGSLHRLQNRHKHALSLSLSLSLGEDGGDVLVKTAA
jgi:hypothetical protein